MLPDRVSNPGPLTYESGVLPTALRGPAPFFGTTEAILGKKHFYDKDKVVKCVVNSMKALV